MWWALLGLLALGSAAVSVGGDSGCCIDCHFQWEEEHIWPHLPPEVREQLQREHDELKSRGYPPAAVLEHAEREMVHFRRHCPAHLVDRVEADHRKLEPKLKARAA